MSSQVIEKLRDKPHLFERFFTLLLPFDHLVMIYCWIIIVLTINFARPIGDFWDVLLFHLGTIVLTFLLARYALTQKNRLVVFFRLFYPVILMTFFYQSCGRLVQVVVPQVFDRQVIALEKAILGINPTLWLDHHLHIVVTELMSAAYFSYYFLIPGLALFLFFGKRDREIGRFVTATCVTFFTSYLAFIIYPVSGPRFYLGGIYENEITGVIFRPVVDFVLARAAFEGGAMPSSHVAEAIIVMLFAIRNYGRKAYFIIPIVIGLALGTIYGRFHYTSDVLAGTVMAFLIYWITIEFYPAKKDLSQKWQLSDYNTKRAHVSDSV